MTFRGQICSVDRYLYYRDTETCYLYTLMDPLTRYLRFKSKPFPWFRLKIVALLAIIIIIRLGLNVA